MNKMQIRCRGVYSGRSQSKSLVSVVQLIQGNRQETPHVKLIILVVGDLYF